MMGPLQFAMFCMKVRICHKGRKKESTLIMSRPVAGLSGSRSDVNSCLIRRVSRMHIIRVTQISPHFLSTREPHHKVSGTYQGKFLTYLSSGALDLSHQICFSQ